MSLGNCGGGEVWASIPSDATWNPLSLSTDVTRSRDAGRTPPQRKIGTHHANPSPSAAPAVVAAWIPALIRRDCGCRSSGNGHRGWCFLSLVERAAAQVLVTGVGSQCHHRDVGGKVAGQTQGARYVGAARNAGEDAFLFGEADCGFSGVLVGDRLDGVDGGGVEQRRREPAPALDGECSSAGVTVPGPVTASRTSTSAPSARINRLGSSLEHVDVTIFSR